MTVYCSGTVRKKQFSFFFNTTAEKNKNEIFEISKFFLPFSEIFGGDSVQLNQFVWPKQTLQKCFAVVL